jgi:UDPglucose--hexose-1-phosphate uridylyltransferase
MSEFRRDPVSNRQVIIAVERSKRPSDLNGTDYSEVNIEEYNQQCFFCVGNEDLTPPETYRIKGDTQWEARAFPNKFPILKKSNSPIEKSVDFFQKISGTGSHEVIVEHYAHNKHFFNMTKKEFKNTLIIYKERYNDFSDEENTQYVCLFKNYLKKAGASLAHPHSQIISLPTVPENILIEIGNCDKFYKENGQALHRVIIEKERMSNERLVYETENFAVICPFASMYNYETEIIYKSKDKFNKITNQLIDELAEVFYLLFQKYSEVLGPFPFNLFLHSHPKGYEGIKYHWHFHIAPRISNQAGFELATGIYVNTVTPEGAASVLRIKK